MDKTSHTEAYEHVDHVVRDPFLRRFAHAALHVRQHQRLYSLTAVWVLALGLFPVFTSSDDRNATPSAASVARQLDEPATTEEDSAPDASDAPPLAMDLEGAPELSLPEPSQPEVVHSLDPPGASEPAAVDTERDDDRQAPSDDPPSPPPPPPAPDSGDTGGDDGCAEQPGDDGDDGEAGVLTDALGGLVDSRGDEGGDETDDGCQPA